MYTVYLSILYVRDKWCTLYYLPTQLVWCMHACMHACMCVVSHLISPYIQLVHFKIFNISYHFAYYYVFNGVCILLLWLLNNSIYSRVLRSCLCDTTNEFVIIFFFSLIFFLSSTDWIKCFVLFRSLCSEANSCDNIFEWQGPKMIWINKIRETENCNENCL